MRALLVVVAACASSTAKPDTLAILRNVRNESWGTGQAKIEAAAKALGELKVDDARAELDAALRLAPRDAHIEADLGVLESQRGRPDEARAHFERAIALDAGYLKPRVQLARLYRDALGDPAAAARVCGELRERFPTSPEAARCQ